MDIGSSSVKMLEFLRADGASTHVRSAGLTPLEPSAVQGNLIQDSEPVAEAIRHLVREHRVKARDVITAVPGPAVIIKRATFPIQSSEDLEETVLMEAGNFIPESLENVTLDYQVIEEKPGTGELEVLLVAVRKEVVNSYVGVIAAAGLTPAVVDVDYFALENMFEMNYIPEPGAVDALINLGARYSTIHVLRGGRSAFTGDVAVGGRQFTEALMSALGLGYGEAEQAKATGESEGRSRDEIRACLAPPSEMIIDEIQRALTFYWTGGAEERIHTIHLSGGTARLPGLAETMSERLRAPVQLTDPFRRIEISRRVDRQFVAENASALAISAGLAARSPDDR